jgi:hypothetical protein
MLCDGPPELKKVVLAGRKWLREHAAKQLKKARLLDCQQRVDQMVKESSPHAAAAASAMLQSLKAKRFYSVPGVEEEFKKLDDIINGTVSKLCLPTMVVACQEHAHHHAHCCWVFGCPLIMTGYRQCFGLAHATSVGLWHNSLFTPLVT